MDIQESQPGVYVVKDTLVRVTPEVLDWLKARLPTSPTKRVRLCAHPDPGDPIHEMLIVLHRDTYVRPHAHPTKSESFHVVEGEGDVVLFDEAGQITDVIHMGDRASNKTFYYRTGPGQFHTLLLRSELMVVHETTNGPFVEGDAVVADWAPAAEDAAAIPSFTARLREEISKRA